MRNEVICIGKNKILGTALVKST